jgi:hypothetical protein
MLFPQAWFRSRNCISGLVYFGFFVQLCSRRLCAEEVTAETFGCRHWRLFFSFGLPLMAEENYAQLIYRCGVPIACYFLWEFFERPKLWKLFVIGFGFVWQFYLGVYNGIFLAMLLSVMAALRPFFVPLQSWMDRFLYWPRRLK